MRKRQYLNNQWIYQTTNEKETIVDLPHSNQIYPYNYLQNHSYEIMSSYKKTFKYQPTKDDVYLVIESILHYAKVYMNQVLIGEIVGGYLKSEFKLSELKENNEIQIVVDGHEHPLIPPFGGVIDYLTYGGINGHVYLEYRDPVYFEDVWFYNDKQFNGYVEGYIHSDVPVKITVQLDDICVKQMAHGQFKIELDTKHLDKWTINNPRLYPLTIFTTNDEISLMIGIRYSIFKSDGFYLNSQKQKLIGLNRHQSFPVVGYAVPDLLDQDDATYLKELGISIVRTAHYPQSHAFINKCDELGILVFTEIPGWQHLSNQERWLNQVCINTEKMVKQYRHHPSIVIWGVRINESIDQDELYTKTNQIAHQFDPSRQTTGVRFIKNSSLLEDVYSYNDFSHTLETPGIEDPNKVTHKHAPYIISEHNGHMFPTKRFDDEPHRLRHALNHARVINDTLKNERVSAVIGWVMNDYHTHQDFGSGDMICYHGINDIYRNPKLAAATYASQQDTTPVLTISSKMNIGEYPGSSLNPLVCFTNCDYVALYKNDTFIKEFYPSNDYRFLKHPPIFIDDLFGDLLVTNEGYQQKVADDIKKVLLAVYQYGQNSLPVKYKVLMGKLLLSKKITFEKGYQLYAKYIGGWGDKAKSYRFIGYKDGKEVITQTIEPVKSKRLKIELSHSKLIEIHSYDMILVKVLAVDQNDLVLDYAFDLININCGPGINVIGSQSISLIGGSGGFMIQSNHIEANSWIRISGNGYQEELIHIDIIKGE